MVEGSQVLFTDPLPAHMSLCTACSDYENDNERF